MTKTFGPNLGLLENAATGEAHDSELRALLRGLDGLVMPNVKGYLTNTPPASPASGDCYIIGAAPTGAWAGKAAYVTRWSATAAAWEFYLPKNGWMLQANSARESYRYTSGAWEIFYQEGTWTPAAYGSTGSIGTYSANAAVGLFTKIGRLIAAQCYLNIYDKGSWTGATHISGLPFAANPTGNAYNGASIGLCSNITLPAGYSLIAGYVNVNQTSIDLVLTGSGIPAIALDYSKLAAGAVAFSLSTTYMK